MIRTAARICREVMLRLVPSAMTTKRGRRPARSPAQHTRAPRPSDGSRGCRSRSPRVPPRRARPASRSRRSRVGPSRDSGFSTGARAWSPRTRPPRPAVPPARGSAATAIRPEASRALCQAPGRGLPVSRVRDVLSDRARPLLGAHAAAHHVETVHPRGQLHLLRSGDVRFCLLIAGLTLVNQLGAVRVSRAATEKHAGGSPRQRWRSTLPCSDSSSTTASSPRRSEACSTPSSWGCRCRCSASPCRWGSASSPSRPSRTWSTSSGA